MELLIAFKAYILVNLCSIKIANKPILLIPFCDSAGSSYNYHGKIAVETHMTNYQMTDPEGQKLRLSILVREFSIRKILVG